MDVGRNELANYSISDSSPLHAVGFAAVASASGLAVLYYGVNGLTAGLGLANLILYTSIYTPMKRYSILNTWVGSIGMAAPVLQLFYLSNTTFLPNRPS